MMERRDLQRLQMRCDVSLWKPSDGTFTRTITENLTSAGFYCQAEAAYVVGDELQATLEIPALHWNGRPGSSFRLQCQVEVLRVAAQESGIACRIKAYTVLTDVT
jgi:hypothetical protein